MGGRSAAALVSLAFVSCGAPALVGSPPPPPCALSPIPFAADALLPDAASTPAIEADAACVVATGRPVDVVGNTDDTMTPEYAMMVSDRMAVAIARRLIALGVDARDVRVVPHGRETPLCDEPTDPCRDRNRRVEVRFR